MMELEPETPHCDSPHQMVKLDLLKHVFLLKYKLH